MTQAIPVRTQAERADQTRSRILDAALAEFGSNGLAGARTERIAEAAGVNKALIYYYFQGKEDLYAAALESGRANFNHQHAGAGSQVLGWRAPASLCAQPL